jgi:hypothetical protein
LKVTLVDLDFESQDLTRFFKVRPYFNETLELLLTQGNFISVEQVSQSSHKVWEGDSLEIVPPAPALEGLLRANQCTLRQFRLVLEVIDSQRDVVIVDMAGIPSSVARKLYDIADRVVYLMSLDPSTVHASLMRLKSLTAVSTGEQPIHLAPISVGRDGISSANLIKEFERCLKVRGVTWGEEAVPYISTVRQWPASGSSPLEMGNSNYRRVFHSLGESMGFHGHIEEPELPVIRKILDFSSFVTKKPLSIKSGQQIPLVEKTEVKLLGLPADATNVVGSLITKATIIAAS